MGVCTVPRDPDDSAIVFDDGHPMTFPGHDPGRSKKATDGCVPSLGRRWRGFVVKTTVGWMK